MIVVTNVVALGMAVLLLWAGLEKARDLTATASTLRHLGVLRKSAKFTAGFVAFNELGIALGLVFIPDSAWIQAAVVALAATFALAGMLAIWSRRPIRCGCFGSGGNGYLGGRQVIAFLPWVGGTWTLYVDAVRPSFAAGAARLAMLALIIAFLRAIPICKAQKQASGDRRSAQETFAWLR